MAKDNQVNAGNFRLLHNGAEMADELLAAVEQVRIEDEINLPGMFVITVNIYDFDKGSWRGIDLDTFKLGDEIKVFMGMDETVPMISGEITILEPTFGPPSSVMEIRGYDRMHRLRFGTRRRSFKDMKDSDIASAIASETGLSPEVEDTGKNLAYLFQNNQSNYQFLLERAQRIGYEMFVYDRRFIFRKSHEHLKPDLSLQLGLDLESLSVQLRTLTGGSEVEVRGWDVKTKKEIPVAVSKGSEKSKMAGKASGYELSEKAFGPSAVAMVTEMVGDLEEAEALAKARYNIILKQFISGEGTCNGNPGIRAGKTIEIKGLGGRFSGHYYIVSTVHSYSYDAGYTTKFKVRRTGV